ncbi:MAG: hypothetical protein QOD43_1088, partial [Gaiellaceae bacterium]|nr:hypothetical protein [Gaiellaceae bacterium]
MFPPGSTVAANVSRVGNVTVTQEELLDCVRGLLEGVPIHDVPTGHGNEFELIPQSARIVVELLISDQ